jgi:ribosome-binding protein aMBF1 (putative translation factor)
MSARTDVQIIKHEGLPAFAVIPFSEYKKLISGQSKVPASDNIPHEVVCLMVDREYSIIRAWREYLGLSQAEAASCMGISQSAFSQLENENKRIKKETRKRIAEALGIKEEQLA